jgi:hypothetical protein
MSSLSTFFAGAFSGAGLTFLAMIVAMAMDSDE